MQRRIVGRRGSCTDALPTCPRKGRLHALRSGARPVRCHPDRRGRLANACQPAVLGEPDTRNPCARFLQGANAGWGTDDLTARRDRLQGCAERAYKILAYIGVEPPSADPARAIDRLISDHSGRLAFGSLVRCTVERLDRKSMAWTGTGGDMLGAFMQSAFGRSVAGRCASSFLGSLPQPTRLVILYGMGKKLNYVDVSERLIQQARPPATGAGTMRFPTATVRQSLFMASTSAPRVA